jgi:aspartate aminotransferase
MKEQKKYHPDIHLNLNVRGLSQSPTIEINDLSKKLAREGKQVYKLGLGQSPFPVPPPVVEELKANAHQKDYLPVKGLEELRDAVCGYYRRTQNIEYSSEDIIVGPGSKELMFILQLVYYGDLVIPTPSWVSYAPQAQIIGRHIRWVPTFEEDDWRLTPEALETLCNEDPDRPRIIVINYPNNPSGMTYRVEELKALARVARKYRAIVLSDEIYGELNHSGHHVSIARFYPEGTIISSGLSKWCGAGGWRLGTFIFPQCLGWLLDAMVVVASETYTSTSAPIQYAAVRAFKGGILIEHYLFHARRILKTLGRYIAEKLQNAGVRLKKPMGGFYLFPDFNPFKEKLKKKEITTSTELCHRLIEETGVAMLPGTSFGRAPDELTARLAYVDFDGARAMAASEQVAPYKNIDIQFIKDYCNNPVAATDHINEWLHEK